MKEKRKSAQSFGCRNNAGKNCSRIVTVRPATFLTTESSIELGQDLLWIRALSGMGS
jgi:hypothetical protein